MNAPLDLERLLRLAQARGRAPRDRPVRVVAPAYAPWPGQRLASRSPAETRVVVAGRQIGKTTWAAFETLRVACEKPRSFSAVLAPTYQIAMSAIERLKRFAAFLPGAVWKEQKKRFVLGNGSVIAVFSADRTETIRGPTINGVLWIDEGAYLSEQAYQAALGALGAGNGRVIVTTTPAGRNWVWKEFTSEAPGNAAFQFRSTDSPYTSKERIARLRTKMSVEKAAQEFDAVFLDDLYRAFQDVTRLFVKSLPPRHAEKDPRHVLGLDLGKEQDWLVATLMNKYGEARIVTRFRHRSWADTLPQLTSIARHFQALVVLDHGAGGGYGGVVKDHLERDGVPVLAIKTAVVGTKARVIEQLRADVQWDRIKVLEGEHTSQLRHELEVLQGIKRVLHGQELLVYEAPQLEGEHDDCVISIALANWGRHHGEAGPAEEEVDLAAFARLNALLGRPQDRFRGLGPLWRTP
ncbi:MAG: terminase family protein [Planctomycetes bacterium]|nr:terminase family protein [Planctomycetota bacterium]